MEMYDKLEFFRTYFAKASEKRVFLESLSSKLGKLPENVSILDLGCHDGALMERILSQNTDRLPRNLRIVGVDPSGEALKRFHERKLPPSISLETFAGTTESYLESCKESFDWVISSHSLYWSANLQEVLKAISDSARSGVVVFRGERGICEIQSEFSKLLGNPAERLYDSSDIENALSTVGVPFEKENHQTEIAIPDEKSKEFRWLASFFLQTNDESLSEAEFSRVHDFVRSRGNPFRHDVSFFWLGDARTKA